MTSTISETAFKELRKNQRLLVQELARRGVEITILAKEIELVEARYGDHGELLLDRDSSISPYGTSIVCGEKYLTKQLLRRAGIAVPQGEQFFPDQIEDARRYARTLQRPLIVKPSAGSHGSSCHTDIETDDELEDAIGAIVNLIGERQPFLIEEQRPGMEFRVFVTINGDYAVLHRDPASVTGDGIHSIAELADAETERRMNPHLNCLTPIRIDNIVEKFLGRQGISLQTVPLAGQKIYLRRVSNIAVGGFCEDYTDKVHPSLIEIAMSALKTMHGMRYAGVDILSTDVSIPQTPGIYCVLEINSNPGLNMHVNPGKGQSRNVVSYLADLIFPETKKRDLIQ